MRAGIAGIIIFLQIGRRILGGENCIQYRVEILDIGGIIVKKYKKPEVIDINEKVQNGVPGAVAGAALMVVRAVAKVMKGGIDLEAGMDTPKTLQPYKKN